MAGLQCGVRDKSYFDENIKPSNAVKYVREQADWDGITLFTDRQLLLAKQVKSKYKIALVSESPIVWGDIEWHYSRTGELIRANDTKKISEGS